MSTSVALRASTPASPFYHDVVVGLSSSKKTLPAKYFYDRAGSELYEKITRLPEYYPTRTETALMETVLPNIHEACVDRKAIVELGSGSGRRTELILKAIPCARHYVPIDVSAKLLEATRHTIGKSHPQVEVIPVQGDFLQAIKLPNRALKKPLGFFPGSTIGNFLPVEAEALLRSWSSSLGQEAMMLIGVDLVKAVDVLEAAYDDAAGVTAAFNLNLLHRINRELDADIDPGAFVHRAHYDEDRRRIEMHLVSLHEQEITLGTGERFSFAAGESIHTENSHKYSVKDFQGLAESAGWCPEKVWVDNKRLFSIHLLSKG